MNKRFLITSLGLSLAAIPTLKGSVDSIEYGPQVVLKVDHAADGELVVVPQAKVWFRLVAQDANNRIAPLPDGTLMLCRAYTLHATNGEFLATRCGVDSYLVKSVGMKP